MGVGLGAGAGSVAAGGGAGGGELGVAGVGGLGLVDALGLTSSSFSLSTISGDLGAGVLLEDMETVAAGAGTWSDLTSATGFLPPK